MGMIELCSICKHNVTNETTYLCELCWELDKLELLCLYCATKHAYVGHKVEVVK
jgi:hypothetical protein